jgi:hypothetical protein
LSGSSTGTLYFGSPAELPGISALIKTRDIDYLPINMLPEIMSCSDTFSSCSHLPLFSKHNLSQLQWKTGHCWQPFTVTETVRLLLTTFHRYRDRPVTADNLSPLERERSVTAENMSPLQRQIGYCCQSFFVTETDRLLLTICLRYRYRPFTADNISPLRERQVTADNLSRLHTEAGYCWQYVSVTETDRLLLIICLRYRDRPVTAGILSPLLRQTCYCW